MSAPAMSLNGFAQGDALLREIPSILREQVLTKAVRHAVQLLAAQSAAMAPQPGRATGGIPYTERRGDRAARRRLYQSVGSVVRKYQGGASIVGVAGPQKKHGAQRHSHLVEFGFNHTTGGTLKGSGGRTRDAKQTVRFDRYDYGPPSRRKTGWRRIQATNDDRTGKGRRGSFVKPRPFVRNALENNRTAVQREIEDAVRKFAAELSRNARSKS